MTQTPAAPASDFAAAQKQFDSLCEGCHGEGGNGGDRAPALVNNRSLRTRNEAQILDSIKSGTSAGMPALKLPEGELQSLARWLVLSIYPLLIQGPPETHMRERSSSSARANAPRVTWFMAAER